MSDFDAALEQFDQMLGIEPEAAPEEGTSEPAVSAEAEVPADAGNEETPERPRDEQGRFAKAEEPAETEVDWKDRYENLQSVFGRQGQELGELRQTLDKLNENLSRPEPEVPLPIDQPMVDWFDEQLEQNPQGAAVWAAQNDQSGVLLERAMDYWYEESPRQAAAFERRVELQQLENRFQEQLAAQTRPLQEMSAQNKIASAWEHGRSKFPDLDERKDALVAAANFAPEVAAKTQSDDPAERHAAIEKLYYLAGGMAGFQGQSAQNTEAAAALQAAATNAKLSGTVASQTQSADPQPVDEGDQWLKDIGFDDLLDRYSPETA